MNKRNELKAKLHARHAQQAVQGIPKAKRPAQAAAVSAVAPKKQKFERKFVQPPTPVEAAGTSSATAPKVANKFQFSQSHDAIAGDKDNTHVREVFEAGRKAGATKSGEQISTAVVTTDCGQVGGYIETAESASPVFDADRNVEESMQDLSVDQALEYLQSTDLSAQITARLVAFVSGQMSTLDATQFHKLFPLIRAQRNAGVKEADDLLVRMLSAVERERKEEDQYCFKRPPNIPVTAFSPLNDASENESVHSTEGGVHHKILDTEDGTTAGKSGSELLQNNEEDETQFWAKKSTNEIFELCFGAKDQSEAKHRLFAGVEELLARQPDLLDPSAHSFSAHLQMVFSSSTSVAQKCVSHLVHNVSTQVVRAVVESILQSFNPRVIPAAVISYVAFTRKRLLLSGLQLFTLATYAIEELKSSYPIFPRYESGAAASAKSGCLDQFLDVIADVADEDASLFLGFKRQCDKYAKSLRVSQMDSDDILRNKWALSCIIRTINDKFPSIPQSLPFTGMITQSRSVQADSDRLLASTLRETFELVGRMEKGPAVDSALEKAHQLMRFSRQNAVLIARQIPLLTTKLQSLAQSVGSRELRSTPALPLILYSLDLVIETSSARTHLNSNAHSLWSAIKTVLQIFQQNRKNRQIPLLVDKVVAALIQFVKNGDSCIQEILAENSLLLKDIVERCSDKTDKEVLRKVFADL